MRTLAHPRTLARRPVRALLAQWPLALADDAEGIHLSRVASRRLRELVPALARPGEAHEAAALRRGLRRVTRVLGRSRELDVALVTLTALQGRAPGHDAAVKAVRAHILRERRHARREARGRVDRINVKELAAATMALARRGETPGAIRACARRVAARLGRRAEELEAAIVDAGLIFAAGPLHLVRIALKKFRYTLELSERLEQARLKGSMQRLKDMQTLLGDLHDLQVLSGLVRDVMAQSPPSRRRQFESLVTRVDDEIRGLHSRFVSDREKVVGLLTLAAKVRWTLATLPPPGLPAPPRIEVPAGGGTTEGR